MNIHPEVSAPLELAPVVSLLSFSAPINALDQLALNRLDQTPREFSRNDTLMRVGDRVNTCFVVLDGWLSRERTDRAGRKRIVNVFLPGDFFGVHQSFGQTAIYDYRAMTEGAAFSIPAETVNDMRRDSPLFAAALDWHATRALNIVSEASYTQGQKVADFRVLHKLLELWCRLLAAGKADDDGFDLPIRQIDLADMCALSSVATNRAISRLRKERLIVLEDGRCSFPDVAAAQDACEFDGRFLEPFVPDMRLAG